MAAFADRCPSSPPLWRRLEELGAGSGDVLFRGREEGLALVERLRLGVEDLVRSRRWIS
jgi:hypothetical protein